MKQHELFEGLKSKSKDFPGQGLGGKSLTDGKFELYLTVDKIIFIALAILILLIVVFTLGVEHGKKVQKKSTEYGREVESITNLARVQAAKKSLGFEEKKKPEEVSLKPQEKPKKKAEPQGPEKPENIKKQQERLNVFSKLIQKVKKEEQAKKVALDKYYEVRLMSVTKEEYAMKEVEKLTKKKLLAGSRRSGDYFIVFLGPYPERKEADRAMAGAQKTGSFKDAYIKKITS